VTEVAFHFGAPDKLAYVCRLLRKAVGAGAKVVVVASDADLQRLDADLWALSPTEFLPHTLAADGVTQPSQAPVILTGTALRLESSHDVLVNLADAVPDGFTDFARLIEVVGTDDADRSLARQRWKHYTQLGYTIVRHDLALRG
jgi:DNA polymerase-3 subunit chi